MALRGVSTVLDFYNRKEKRCKANDPSLYLMKIKSKLKSKKVKRKG